MLLLVFIYDKRSNLIITLYLDTSRKDLVYLMEYFILYRIIFNHETVSGKDSTRSLIQI